MVRISPASSVGGTSQLASIQVLRGLAALAIVLAHLWSQFYALGLPNAVPNFILGAAGVDLFFVISGFIMVYTSQAMFGQPAAPARFFLRRVCRIMPLYWIATTALLLWWLTVTTDLSTFGVTWSNVVASYFFLPSPRPSGITAPILEVGWTLNYEMFFYAAFAAAILLPCRFAVLALTIFFLALVNVPAVLGIALPHPLAGWATSFVYEFAFGMWIALAFRGGVKIHPAMSWVMVTAGIALLIFTDLDGFANVPRVAGWGGGAALIVAAVVLADVGPLVSRAWRPLLLLGDASYALYLVHSFAPRPVRALRPFVDPAAHPWVYASLIVAVAIAAAVALHLWLEKPMTKVLQRKLIPRAATPGPAYAAAG